MAQQGCSLTPSRLKLLICVLAVGVGFYILGPPLYWRFVGRVEPASDSYCPDCVCPCDSLPGSDSALPDLAPGLVNVSLADCASDDPDLQSELHSSKVQLLQEELALQEKVAAENQERSDSAFLDAKKLTSQYQKEAEKCNIGMETSEEARERAEAALVVSDRLAALWEQRARALGWKDGEHAETLLAQQPAAAAGAVAHVHDAELLGAFSSFDDSSGSSFARGRNRRRLRKKPNFL